MHMSYRELNHNRYSFHIILSHITNQKDLQLSRKNQSTCLLSVQFIDHHLLSLQSCLAEIDNDFLQYKPIRNHSHSFCFPDHAKAFDFLENHLHFHTLESFVWIYWTSWTYSLSTLLVWKMSSRLNIIHFVVVQLLSHV